MKSPTVREYLEKYPIDCEVLSVPLDEPVPRLLDKLSDARHARTVYVIDDDQKIQGVISWGDLARHFFADGVYSRKSMHPGTGILQYITARHARDLMNSRFLSCRLDEELQDVIHRMLHPPVIKTLPVLDEEGRIIACLDMLDLIRNPDV